MPIPESQRKIYDPNPLVEVTVQFVIPTVLRLDTEPPVALQEAIRDRFPHFRMKESSIEGRSEPLKIYEFISEDGFWLFSLSSEFVHLATANYQDRQSFQKQLRFLLDLFSEIYSVSNIIAFALNYQNVIDRQILELEDVPWKELLNPAFAGEFADAHLEESEIVGSEKRFALRLAEDLGTAEIYHGLQRNEDDQLVYLVDSIFALERPQSFDEAIDGLDAFHDVGGNLFRWAIGEKLREKFEGGIDDTAT